MKKQLVIGGLVAVAVAAGIGAAGQWPAPEMDRIHAKIESSHEGVDHIAASDFLQLSASDVALFDVREIQEYEVSHLPGALQVNPDITAAEFEERFGDTLKNKTVIFYCSVGVRSSRLAERVAPLVERSTGRAPANLIGGAFQWSNEGRPMVTPQGANTNAVHPFDDYWGRLIENRKAISFDPEA